MNVIKTNKRNENGIENEYGEAVIIMLRIFFISVVFFLLDFLFELSSFLKEKKKSHIRDFHFQLEFKMRMNFFFVSVAATALKLYKLLQIAFFFSLSEARERKKINLVFTFNFSLH